MLQKVLSILGLRPDGLMFLEELVCCEPFFGVFLKAISNEALKTTAPLLLGIEDRRVVVHDVKYRLQSIVVIVGWLSFTELDTRDSQGP